MSSVSSQSSSRDSRKLAPLFNRKLFTNFGESRPASRPAKRLRVVSEAVIFGQATATDHQPTQRKRPPERARVAAAAVHTETKFVSLQNYVNLLNLIDGLRHQLPNFGYDLYVPSFARTLFDTYECQTDGTTNTSSATTNTSSSLGAGTLDDQCSEVVLADVSSFTAKRLDWSALSRTQLLPILRLLSTGYRDEFRPANKNHMAQTFVLNRAAKRWDQLLTSAAEYAPDDTDQSRNFQGTIDADDKSFVADGQEAVVQQLRKFLTEARASLVENPHASLDRAELINASSTEAECACCQFAPHVLVRSTFASNSTTDLDHYLRPQFSLPVVTFDVASFLCGSVPAATFTENYTLRHIMQKQNSDLDVDLVKTLYVSSLTFFERLYAVHWCLGVLIDWCWTRHRLAHTVLQGSNCTCESVPPVVVLVNRSLQNLLQRIVALPTLTLARERKFVYHVV